MYKYIAIALTIVALGIALGQSDSTIHLRAITATSKTATSTYSWELAKTADLEELEFTTPFTDEKQVKFRYCPRSWGSHVDETRSRVSVTLPVIRSRASQ